MPRRLKPRGLASRGGPGRTALPLLRPCPTRHEYGPMAATLSPVARKGRLHASSQLRVGQRAFVRVNAFLEFAPLASGLFHRPSRTALQTQSKVRNQFAVAVERRPPVDPLEWMLAADVLPAEAARGCPAGAACGAFTHSMLGRRLGCERAGHRKRPGKGVQRGAMTWTDHSTRSNRTPSTTILD
jgi:hypothetical protein